MKLKTLSSTFILYAGVTLGAEKALPLPQTLGSEIRYQSRACQDEEKWSAKTPGEFYSSFLASIRPEPKNAAKMAEKEERISKIQGFSEAIALRSIDRSPASQAFTEYWIGRMFYETGMVHTAFQAFSHLSQDTLSADLGSIQVAALECMIQIQNKHPALKPNGNQLSRLIQLFENNQLSESHLSTLLEMAALLAPEITKSGKTAEFVRAIESRSVGSYASHWILATRALRDKKHATASTELKLFLAAPPNPFTEHNRDMASMQLGRSLYALGEFQQAAQQYKLVRRSSNELAESLSELAWAQLMAEEPRDAIGVAISLQSGGLVKTFAPEALMVMAMGYNELCLYPDSIHAIGAFKRNYKDAYLWLQSWNKNPEPIYPLVAEFLNTPERFKEKKIPIRVSTQWVRSPEFISRQQELNLLSRERGLGPEMGKRGKNEVLTRAQEILAMATGLKKPYLKASLSLKPGQKLPPKILEELALLQKKVTHYRRLQRGAPVFLRILSAHESFSSSRKATLAREIETYLSRVTKKMALQLDEIAENNQLIEVEIYNGASQDLIWKNAHPDYPQMVQNMKQNAQRAIASQVWDWGKMSATLEGTNEVWEDELGSFSADLYNNCESKDKYMAIKRIGERE